MKRGTIETLKLFKLFKGLYDQRASGWLLLKTGHVERRVYLQEGAPTSVISTAPQEQLLWRCVYEGVCSSSEAAQFEEKINTDEVKLSELLVNSGIASKSRIHQLSIDLISDLIWDCLSWSEGDFGWTTDGTPTGDLTPVDPFYLLCMSGQESLTDDLRSFIQQQIEGQSAQLASLNTDELNVLRELLGDQLVQRLTQGCDLNALISLVFQTAPEEKQLFLTNIIYALLVSGFFHLGDLQDPPTAQPGSSRVNAQSDSSPSAASQINRAFHSPASIGESITPQPTSKTTRPSSSAQRLLRDQRKIKNKDQAAQETPRPQAYINPKAQVNRQTVVNPSSKESEVQQTGPHVVKRREKSNRPRDSRIIKPPQNWRKFSIGKQSSIAEESSTTRSTPKLEDTTTPTDPIPPVSPISSHHTQPNQQVNQSKTNEIPDELEKLSELLFGDVLEETTQASSQNVTGARPLSSHESKAFSKTYDNSTSPKPNTSISSPLPSSSNSPKSPSSTSVNSSPLPPPPSKRAPLRSTSNYTPTTSGDQSKSPSISRQDTPSKTRRALTPEIKEKIETYSSLFEQRNSLTHYELLGVSPQVDETHLRKTFKKLAGSLHIDRFLRYEISEQTLENLKQLFISMNRAYQVLVDPKERREYDLILAQSQTNSGPQPTDLGQLLRAEQLTREAINFLKQGKTDLALNKVNEAQQINSDDQLNDAIKIYCQALQLKAQGASSVVLRQSIERLEVLVLQFDGREEPFLYLGLLYGHIQEYKKASSAFERALAINPHYVEAKSQLRHIKRHLDEPQRGGLFNRRKKT